jgi:hypothetical protein
MSSDKKIGIILLFFGALGIAASIIYEAMILVFIGLTLSFWGCLFLLILPDRHVKIEILDKMCYPTLSALNDIIAVSDLLGKPIYMPVPRELFLPYDIGFKNEFVYLPKENIEAETAIEQAYMHRTEGLRLIPPGLGLTDLMEKKSNMSFHKLDLYYLTEVLPSIITEDLELADNFKISLEGNKVYAEINNPVCKDLCMETDKLPYICPHIGCPLCSSIACILTRVTNRPVIIVECSLRNNIEAIFQILKG